jgi:antitoxin component of RelBE/YafQ-DinJ toxin-antitoxin module
MNLKELVGKLPETDRPAAEAAIQEAITAANPVAGIDSKERAAEYIGKNAYFKAALDAGISRGVEAHDEKFMAEKFPKLAKAEADKREQEVTARLKPELDPVKALELQIKKQAEDFNSILAERDKKEVRDAQRLLALKLAAEEKIPVTHIERFIDDDDEKTTASVKAYAKSLKDYAKAETEAALNKRLGNTGTPKGGAAIPPADLKTRYAEALKDPKRADEALALHEQIEQAARAGQ